MADDTEDDLPPPPSAPSPMLQGFESAFSDPVAQDWAREVSVRVNDYDQQKRIADASTAAGQQFVQNLDDFKTGLTGAVQADPHFVHTALDLVPLTVGALVDTMPGGIENPDEHHASVTGHIQHEVAAAAVTSAAEQHAGLARDMLSNERISSVLGDSVKPLNDYIDMQEQARERDDAAQRGQQAAAQVKMADNAARDYLGTLVGPDGKPASPNGWNQALIADKRVPPQDKLELMGVHDRLGTVGDQPTNPTAAAYLIHRFATGQASQRDLYPMLGNNLSMQDAGMIAKAQENPQFLANLDEHIQTAQRQIAPNGDIAETRALGRFTDHLLGQIHNGGSLDPQAENYVMPAGEGDPLSRFRVNGDDLARDYGGGGGSAKGQRLTLPEIFSNDTYRRDRGSGPARLPQGSGIDPTELAQYRHDEAVFMKNTDRRLLRQRVDPASGETITELDPQYANDKDGLARGVAPQFPQSRGSGGTLAAGPEPGDEIVSGPSRAPARVARTAPVNFRPSRRGKR